MLIFYYVYNAFEVGCDKSVGAAFDTDILNGRRFQTSNLIVKGL